MAYPRNPYDQIQQPQTPPTPPLLRAPMPVQVAGDPGNRSGALLNSNSQRMMDELYPPERPDPNAAPTQVPPRGEPDKRGLVRRALDFVFPPAGAAEMNQGGGMPPASGQMPAPVMGGMRPYIGAGSDYPMPQGPALLPAQAPAPQRQNGELFPQEYDPLVMRRQLGQAINMDRATGMRRKAQGLDEDAARAAEVDDAEYAARAQDRSSALLGEADRLIQRKDGRHYPSAPLMSDPGASSAPVMQGGASAPLLPSAGSAPSLKPPDGATRLARESGPMDFPADVVPHYRRGADGALTLAMPNGGSASLLPAPGSRQMQARVNELDGQRLGLGRGYETDAQVAARRPDLYGPDGKPRLADAFGNAIDQGLARDVAVIDERNAERARGALASGLLNRANALADSAEGAKSARVAAARQGAAMQLYGTAAQANADNLRDATNRRGQDMQPLGREKRSPVSVKTADGGEVLFDPGSGQWLQPPGAQGSGIAKQDHERLKGITGHIGKAMGMDSAANPIDAATGAAYTAASRIGGGAYMATRGVRQFAGYTDADFAGIGQDVAAGRAAIRTGKDGMAYAIYHGENGKAYGVPIGPAANYANFQPAAGQPAVAR